ncbi:uncharacterized protein EI90DRAFT_3069704 [Cantharellus anzutake]|uniref:uncharacterized protein n=1 Tax=Cantharellus anzutake TaxID=1750568 RepID=UPI001908474E|nr:uncharacterized protein EI90DRAFT_3069704 [Cantharellus anzutake]KAF8326564.1 hypothetical protein EI90DRAFT_3069704 [Cantharellus anzutake]
MSHFLCGYRYVSGSPKWFEPSLRSVYINWYRSSPYPKEAEDPHSSLISTSDWPFTLETCPY